MSYESALDPECSPGADDIELLIRPRTRDLGEFSVRRVLPASDRQMVGPFIFFDHMGPAEFPPGQGIQVRPHPHIGLAAITYLFDGEIVHRDSLGYHQPIRPGAVNLMTAGRGIVHSERAGPDLNQHSTLHGIQSWMALPDGQEDIEPAFDHIPAGELPQIQTDGAVVRLIMGQAFGRISPVTTFAPTLYLELQLEANARQVVPRSVEELAVYVVSGAVRIGARQLAEGTMAVICAGSDLTLRADQASRVMVIGGAPIGRRHLWWNFVASSRDRIERAKDDWRSGRFDTVAGDDEFIPLPEQAG